MCSPYSEVSIVGSRERTRVTERGGDAPNWRAVMLGVDIGLLDRVVNHLLVPLGAR
jgi:hypothetical protein